MNLFSYSQALSALGIAVSKNDCATVRLLLDHGADMGHCDNYAGGSVIYRAVECGSISITEMMLEHHTKYGRVDDDGRDLVHWASAAGHADIIFMLHNEGLQMNCQDKYDSTPLHEASRHGKIEAIDTLLGLGIDTSIKDNDGNSAIDVALQYGETEATSLLTGKDPINEGRATGLADESKRPVWALAKAGRLDLMVRAKTAGIIDLSQRETRTNMNALHFAALYGHTDILNYLLQSEAIPVNDLNHHKHTPLHMAAISNNVNATRALLNQRGAEPDRKDRWGDTPLSIATYRMHYHVAVLLVEAHADLDAKFVGRHLQTLFFEAVELNSVGAVRVLIDKGVDVVGRNEEGEMALQVALRRDHGEMEGFLRESSSFFRSASEDKENGVKRKNDGGVDYAASPRQKPKLER